MRCYASVVSVLGLCLCVCVIVSSVYCINMTAEIKSRFSLQSSLLQKFSFPRK